MKPIHLILDTFFYGGVFFFFLGIFTKVPFITQLGLITLLSFFLLLMFAVYRKLIIQAFREDY